MRRPRSRNGKNADRSLKSYWLFVPQVAYMCFLFCLFSFDEPFIGSRFWLGKWKNNKKVTLKKNSNAVFLFAGWNMFIFAV
jgi:hypothetical protein